MKLKYIKITLLMLCLLVVVFITCKVFNFNKHGTNNINITNSATQINFKNNLLLMEDGTVSIIDSKNDTLLQKVNIDRFGDCIHYINPQQVVFSIFPLEKPAKLGIMSDNITIKYISLKRPALFGIISNNKYLYCSHSIIKDKKSYISVLNHNFNLVQEIAIPDIAQNLTVDNNGRIVFNYYTNNGYQVGVINELIFSPLTSEPKPIFGFGIAPNNDIYLLCQDKEAKASYIDIIDSCTGKSKQKINLAIPELSKIAFLNNKAYITHEQNNTVTIVDLNSSRVLKYINSITNPYAITTMNNKVYIASHSIPGKVIILDGMTDTIIKEINVGNRPLCFDK